MSSRYSLNIPWRVRTLLCCLHPHPILTTELVLTQAVRLRPAKLTGVKCLKYNVGRTHTIMRLPTRIRRKDGTENIGGFVFVLDLYNGILCCGFVCARLISVSFPATTPRATTPHRSLSRLPRRGLTRPTDTLRRPRRGLPRPYK